MAPRTISTHHYSVLRLHGDVLCTTARSTSIDRDLIAGLVVWSETFLRGEAELPRAIRECCFCCHERDDDDERETTAAAVLCPPMTSDGVELGRMSVESKSRSRFPAPSLVHPRRYLAAAVTITPPS